MDSDAEIAIRRSLRKWRVTAILALLALVGSVLWSAYALVDAGITLAYRDDSLRSLQEANLLLEQVALRISPATSKAELLRLLQDLGIQSWEKEGAVQTSSLSFYFSSSNRLACVTATYPPDGTPCAPFFRPVQ